MLYKKKEHLSVKEADLVNMLKKRSVEILRASELTEEFKQMMENKNEAQLQCWINKVNHYELKELKGFANGLLNDHKAVKNAISLPWSNGPVEGHINKLKKIKRQMYGRAEFNLLRKRILLGYG